MSAGMDPPSDRGPHEGPLRLMLGADIGGTKVAVAAVDEAGGIHGSIRTRPTDTRDEEALLAGLSAGLRDALADAPGPVLGIGVGCAGTIDWSRGRVVQSPNLPLVDFALVDRLTEALGLPVVLDNDANVATWAEARVGAARGLRQVIMLTLGTGVGGGIVLDGRLYRGASGAAGELGHTVVLAGGVPCHCGRRGCLEMYASGTALERTAHELAARAVVDRPAAGPDAAAPPYGERLAHLAAAGLLAGEDVGRLAGEGDQAAQDAVAHVGSWLGQGLADLANIFNPEMIVVGGGLSSLGEMLLEPARKVLTACGLAPNKDEARVAVAELGAQAGVVGAALVAWAEHRPG